MTEGVTGMSRRALGQRVGVVAAIAVVLCCAAPAQAQVSGGDDPEPASGLLPPSGDASLSGTQQVGQTLTGSDNFGPAPRPSSVAGCAATAAARAAA